MAKKGQKGSNARFLEQLMVWVALNNPGLRILLREGYILGKAIGGSRPGIEKWPIEIYRCGVCELPKPTGKQRNWHFFPYNKKA